MKFPFPLVIAVPLLLGVGVVAQSQGSAQSALTASADRKIAQIEHNGRLAHPDQVPTRLTEEEINAYLASGDLEFPAGVKSVQLQGQPGVITGHARVDFDQVRAGHGTSNPLLSMFSGVHDVEVVAHAHGAGHQGFVDVDTVSLDGVEIPRFVLQLFVEKYIQPKYPGIGLQSRFPLPDKIDTAVVGAHQVTLTQK